MFTKSLMGDVSMFTAPRNTTVPEVNLEDLQDGIYIVDADGAYVTDKDAAFIIEDV